MTAIVSSTIISLSAIAAPSAPTKPARDAYQGEWETFCDSLYHWNEKEMREEAMDLRSCLNAQLTVRDQVISGKILWRSEESPEGNLLKCSGKMVTEDSGDLTIKNLRCER